MLFSPWLRLFSARLARIFLGRRRIPSVRSLNSVRVASHTAPALTFERLEDRTLLATLTVNASADNTTSDSVLTLREAVLLINNAGNAGAALGRALTLGEQAQINLADPFGTDDIVQFDAVTNAVPINLSGTDIDVTSSAEINGNGQTNTIIDGQLNSRIFNVTGVGTDFEIDGLTLRNGRTSANGDDGGAIEFLSSNADLFVFDSTLSNNSTAGNSARGGAIISTQTTSEVLIFRSAISGNSTSGSASHGGAIYSLNSEVTIAFSTVSGNSTSNFGAHGGALFSNNGDIQIINSIFDMNSTDGSGSVAGAIGAGTGAAPRTIDITSSTFSGNFTTSGTSPGGAISVDDDTVNVFNSTFHGNHVDGTGSDGGAIHSGLNGDVNVVQSTISGNMAAGNGGGIYTDDGNVRIIQSTITNNSAYIGGGIDLFDDNNGETLTIHNSIVAGNTATLANPDFTGPGNPGVNLDARSNLIGHNDGTSLAETGGAVPDGNFNFVGGSGGGSLNPLLGPLQDNGGSTFTHALLAGSIALNSGNNLLAESLGDDGLPGTNDANEISLTNDQRAAPFLRIVDTNVDMGAFEAQPLLIMGDAATISGTSGDDTILYRVTTRLAIVNGVAYHLPANVNDVRFDGGAGNDRFDLIGTSGDDSALTRPKQVFFEFDAAHAGFDVTAVDMETVILDGNGGNDTATLRDTVGAKDEKLFARPSINNALLFANDASYFSSVFGFNVTTLFSDGNDRALFFDSGAVEVAIVRPGNASLSSQGLLTNVQSFDTFLARSLTGNDIANVFGTAGIDFFTGRNGFAVMTAGGQDLLFDSYATINANGLQGDDLVRFNGNAGDDLLVATGTTASFTTGVSVINTTSFGRLIADARTGANDRAILTGTNAADAFSGSPNFGELTGAGFFHRTNNFGRITIDGLGGVNTLTDNGINYVLIQQGIWV